MILDGDDRLFHNNVLLIINSYYTNYKNLAVTSGQETVVDRSKVRLGLGKNNPYLYKFQHPHTFRYFCLKQIDHKHLQDDLGQYITIGEDVLRFYATLCFAILNGYSGLRLPHILAEINNSHGNNSADSWKEQYFEQNELTWSKVDCLYGNLEEYNCLTSYECKS